MPTRLLLEGRDLEELLAQVRDEHGPDAVIVSAEKVRSGGFGGLFGQEKYELTVEIADKAVKNQPSTGSPAASAATPATAGAAAAASAAPTAALSIEDLAAMADAADLNGKPTGTPPDGGSGPAFAAMLDDVRGADGQGAAALAGDRPATAADALNRLLAGEAAPEVSAEPAPSVRTFRPNANQPVAKLGVRQLTAARAEPTNTGAAEPGSESTATRQEQHMPVEVTVDKPRTADASEKLAAAYNANGGMNGSAERVAAERPATDRPFPERQGAERQSNLARRLQSLGVPADVAFRATGPDTYTAVVEAFAALPAAEPPPDGPGETLIVIGESTHAVEVARIVAENLRLDADEILFAGRNAAAAGIDQRRRITGAHDARSWAKRLRKSDAPSVVAIEAALDESAWAASIVESIRPVAVWVVVDASRKTSDVAHHLQGLRRVDAIALRATMASGDPASPLSLRLPIALLDGRQPTPHAWAAMLCERLSLVGG